MTNPDILVTTARGKVGTYVVNQLREYEIPVRALVHRLDTKAEQLRTKGADVIVANLNNLNILRPAMNGIKKAYFGALPSNQLLQATTTFAIAGKGAGLEILVNMSQIITREEPDSPLTRQHWLSEIVSHWSGINTVHLRLTYFMEMLLMFAGNSIVLRENYIYPMEKVNMHQSQQRYCPKHC